MKSILLIDGGYLRNVARDAGYTYTNDFIEAFARVCVLDGEALQRVLYYDCPQYRGKQRLPVSGETKQFTASDRWLTDLACRELFAVRRGTLAFRGWVPRSTPIEERGALTDDHFRPNFEQKGVDMRIGLDIATISANGRIDRIVLLSGDTDLIPATKHARKANLEVVGIQLPIPPAQPLRPALCAHLDGVRHVEWPEAAESERALPQAASP